MGVVRTQTVVPALGWVRPTKGVMLEKRSYSGVSSAASSHRQGSATGGGRMEGEEPRNEWSAQCQMGPQFK